jgi:hypothetical protein
MALTMINPTSSWFKMVELFPVTRLRTQTGNGKEELTANKNFSAYGEVSTSLLLLKNVIFYKASCGN